MVALVVFTSALAVRPAEAINLKSWDKQINDPTRFKVLGKFAREAVLDKETGLVWEQSPSNTFRNWFQAINDCYNKKVGGRIGRRKGWRLPTIEELMSLVDPNEVNPSLPNGHPFDDVEPDRYWSATTRVDLTGNALMVFFISGDLVYNFSKSSGSGLVWCVRGGQGHDGF